MLKYGLGLLFGTFTQLIAVIISYEFYYTYAQNHGGVNVSSSISIVHPLIWCIIFIELMISLYLLAIGIKAKAD